MFPHVSSSNGDGLPPLSDVTGSKLLSFNALLAEMLPPTQLFSKLNPSINPQDLFASEIINSRTFVRARPLVAEEVAGQKPCTSLPFVKLVGKRDGVLVTFKMTPNGNPLLEPHRIPLDGGIFCSFAGKDTNEDVYESILPPILARCSQGNGSAAVLMYGAFGTGKTYTTRGLVECLTQDMISFLSTTIITMNVLEIHALGIMDVLTGEDVQMLENMHNPDGTGVKLVGATDFRLQSSTTMKKVLNLVFAVRDKNPKASALSTLVFRFLCTPKSADPDVVKAGQIFIVDLASYDSLASVSSSGSLKSQKELSRNIVSSFAAYRDCIRLRVAHLQTATSGGPGGAGGGGGAMSASTQEELPFRTSPLTLLLNGCFDMSARFAKVATICCVSPHISQMKTIGETLKFATALCVNGLVSEEKAAFSASSADPLTWSLQKMHDFFVQASSGRLRNPREVFNCPDARGCIELISSDEAIDKMVELHGYPKRVFQSMWQEMLRILLEQKGTNASSMMLAKKQTSAATNSNSTTSGGGVEKGNAATTAKAKFASMMKLAVQQEQKKEGKEPVLRGSRFVEVVKEAVSKAKASSAAAEPATSSTVEVPTASSSSKQIELDRTDNSSAPMPPNAPSSSSPKSSNPRSRSVSLAQTSQPDEPLVDFGGGGGAPSTTATPSTTAATTPESSMTSNRVSSSSGQAMLQLNGSTASAETGASHGQQSLTLSLSLGVMSANGDGEGGLAMERSSEGFRRGSAVTFKTSPDEGANSLGPPPPPAGGGSSSNTASPRQPPSSSNKNSSPKAKLQGPVTPVGKKTPRQK